MSDTPWTVFKFMLFMCVCFFMIGAAIGVLVAQRQERGKAVEAGVGHYVTDPKAGMSIDFVYEKKE